MPVSKNQQLANKAYKTVVQSKQYKHGNNSTLNKAFQIAKAAHNAAHRKGPGPTPGHILTAAVNWELKQ